MNVLEFALVLAAACVLVALMVWRLDCLDRARWAEDDAAADRYGSDPTPDGDDMRREGWREP